MRLLRSLHQHRVQASAGNHLPVEILYEKATAQRLGPQCHRALWSTGMHLRTASADVSLPCPCAGPFRVGSGGICAGDRRCDRKRGGVRLRYLRLSGNVAATQRTPNGSPRLSPASWAPNFCWPWCALPGRYSRADSPTTLLPPGAVLGQYDLGRLPGHQHVVVLPGPGTHASGQRAGNRRQGTCHPEHFPAGAQAGRWLEGDGGAVRRLRGSPWGHGGSGVSRSGLSMAYTLFGVERTAAGRVDVPVSGRAEPFRFSEPAGAWRCCSGSGAG